SSYVFQTPRLLPWRTVLDNIQLAMGENSSPTSVIESLLESLGLKNCLYKYPQQLSLGMQRRVALARAFSVPSDLLLMDEPFVSLDQATARNARKLLLRLWAEQARKVIFVTHDLNEAFELADRILFLSESPSHIIADIPIDIPQLDRSAADIKKLKERASIDHPSISSLL
ncbi:MAG: ABC transporter ATP-binding protein, partial [Cycloclasticus sp.]|nr:ABC transporter ATP-binding protein [Cycloclasticus sp.]